MSKPGARRIAQELKALRVLIENSSDPCEQRIAHGMEIAIRWATEHTDGWPAMHADAKHFAGLLRKEIMANVATNVGTKP